MIYPLPRSFWSVAATLVFRFSVVECVASPEEPINFTTSAVTTFSDKLTNVLYKNPNECTSSWGISMAFDLIRPGAEDETMFQLCDTMGLCGDQERLLWNDVVNEMTMRYDGSCIFEYRDSSCVGDLPLLNIANSIWIDESLTLQTDYEFLVGTLVQQTDFGASTAGDEINTWVNRTTSGLIETILPEGPIPGDMAAVNTIYLKAPWQEIFTEHATTTDFFYENVNRADVLSEVRYMHSVREIPYSGHLLEGHQVISLDFASPGLSMVFVLPMRNDTEHVSSEKVLEVLPRLEPSEVALALPKFDFESTYESELDTALKLIGMTAAYKPPGFCGLVSSLDKATCLWVSEVIQKTFISLDEGGTLAAAATAIILTRGSTTLPITSPTLFLADHPFQFFIVEHHDPVTGGIIPLFEGRVGVPSETSIPATDRHTDPDFWFKYFDIDQIHTYTPSETLSVNVTGNETIYPSLDVTYASSSLACDDEIVWDGYLDNGSTTEPCDSHRSTARPEPIVWANVRSSTPSFSTDQPTAYQNLRGQESAIKSASSQKNVAVISWAMAIYFFTVVHAFLADYY